MNKGMLWLFFVLLIAYFALVFCEENSNLTVNDESQNALQAEARDLEDEARTRRRHKYHHYWWAWNALAIAYWVKVKVVIVSFFLGSALFLGLRYYWPQRCPTNVVRDTPIIYENPHSFEHHDYVPYHSDHHHAEHSSFDPYSAYSGSYSDISEIASTAPDSSGPALPTAADVGPHSIRKRSAEFKRRKQFVHQMPTEEQIANFMFAFLGLDSKACRRRFICEMEFRSKENSLTSLGFRMVGRGFFEKYLNRGKASSFAECAIVNPECVFIERDDDEEPSENTLVENDELGDQTASASGSSEANTDKKDSRPSEASSNENEVISTEDTVRGPDRVQMEEQNTANLLAERQQRRRKANLRRRGVRKTNDYITARVLAQSQSA